MFIVIGGLFLFIVVAGVSFWEFGNSLAVAKLLLLVVSRYVDVRKK